MTCAHCDGETVAFAVPDALAEHADTTVQTICARCLRVEPSSSTGPPADPEFSLVHDDFPTDDAGAALALALGMLDSLALNRAAVVACCRYAEEAGVDVLLALDRIGDSPDVSPHFDFDRRRPQLEQVL